MNDSLRRYIPLFFGALLFLVTANSLRAGVYLEFANNGATIQVNQGGSFEVTLNLLTSSEEVGGTNYRMQVEEALAGFVTLTSWDVSTSVFTPIWTESEVLELPGAILDPTNSLELTSYADHAVGPNTYLVAVMTFSVSASAPVGTFDFGTFSPAGTGWFDSFFQEHGLDGSAALNLEIVAVPEPGSVLLVAGSLLALGVMKRRRVRFIGNAAVAVLVFTLSDEVRAQTPQPWPDYEYQQIRIYSGATLQNALNYRICRPMNYVADGSVKYPLVIFWHGNGNFDYEPFDLNDPTKHNSAQMTEDGWKFFMSPANQAIFPCYLVAMQRGTMTGQDNNTERFCAELVDYLVANRNVDPDRVIITGLSGGGGRTLACAYSNPTKYAAIVPLSTIYGGSGDPATLAQRIKEIPIWLFHAANDPTVGPGTSDNIVRELRKLGAKPIYTRYQFGGHVPDMWRASYSTPALVPWLAAQRRSQSQQADPARVNILLPTDEPAITVSSLNVDLRGRVEILASPGNPDSALITTVSGTKITSSGTSAFSIAGESPWMSIGTVSLQSSGTTALIAVARGTSWAANLQGYTTYSDSLLVTRQATPPDSTAPVVQITSPTTLGTWTTTAATMNLAGTATDNMAVKSVDWSSDRGGFGSTTGTTSWSASAVPLVTGTNVLTIQARDEAGNFGSQNLIVIRNGPQPVDTFAWTGSNVGSPGANGSFSFVGGTMTIVGSGSKMWASDNHFYFVHQPVVGDTILIARILSQEGRDSGENHTGLLISEGLSGTSRYFMAGSGNGDRAVLRASYTAWGASGQIHPRNPPYWIKLERAGNNFSAYISSSGTGNWEQISTTQGLGIGTNAYVGFMVNSGRTGVLSTAVFDNVSISRGTKPVLVNAVSRKSHGAVGNFDVALPVVGTSGIEARRGTTAGNLSVRLIFSQSVASGNVTVSAGSATVDGTPVADGSALVVNLTNVADNQTLTLDAKNVIIQGGTLAGEGKLTFRVLSGDANANGNVSTVDLAKIQANAGKLLQEANFTCDIDGNGVIDSVDFTLARAKLGAAVP